LVEVGGRLVLLGDHTHVVKDGGRMPGVLSLRETSETQSKPSYFRGQCWGALGVLVGSMNACFCLPLTLQLHLGFQHLGEQTPALTLSERLVAMALEFARTYERSSWLILDAFFATESVFRLAQSVWSVSLKQPYLHIITRAKKNYVGYCPPTIAEQKPRGRPAKFGTKVVLSEVFDHADTLFNEVPLTLYGKQEVVKMMAANLLWRPIGDALQFVWVISSRGSIVLMCSDLTIAPTQIVELYCRRVRIEILFDTLKNVLGAFCFHFWSTYQPRHSRRPTSNRHLKAASSDHLATIKGCWQAMEVFVFCACIATGLLQIFSLKYHDGLWRQRVLFLRTQSRELPSENTVRQILAPMLAREFNASCQNSLWRQIRGAIPCVEDEEDFRHCNHH
jgi:hypothetical protein